MANDKVCIFCGEKPGAFRSDTLLCGGTIQTCCKACARELKGASEEELCRRALGWFLLAGTAFLLCLKRFCSFSRWTRMSNLLLR